MYNIAKSFNRYINIIKTICAYFSCKYLDLLERVIKVPLTLSLGECHYKNLTNFLSLMINLIILWYIVFNDIHIFSTDCVIMNSLSLVRMGMHDQYFPNVLYLLVISSNTSMPFGFCVLSGVVLGPHYLLLFYLADLDSVYYMLSFLRFWW